LMKPGKKKIDAICLCVHIKYMPYKQWKVQLLAGITKTEFHMVALYGIRQGLGKQLQVLKQHYFYLLEWDSIKLFFSLTGENWIIVRVRILKPMLHMSQFLLMIRNIRISLEKY